MSERDACQGISVFEHGNGNDTRPFKYWLISVRCAHPSLEQTLAIAFMTVVTRRLQCAGINRHEAV
jgi:hypothetical protein